MAHNVCCYETLFRYIRFLLDGSYGYRPNRSVQQAIQKVKEYAEQGYTTAVEIDLSKYFDTLNHELLMNMVREEVKDKRVTDLVKKYLKSGVLVEGLLVKTEGIYSVAPSVISNEVRNPFLFA